MQNMYSSEWDKGFMNTEQTTQHWIHKSSCKL